LGISWFTDPFSQRYSSESNLARSIAGQGEYCHDGSIVDLATHMVLDKTADDSDISGQIDCDDDSTHTDARSDSASASLTAVPDAEFLPDSTTQDSIQISPSQMPLWHDMALLANSSSIPHTEKDKSHGVGYAVLKLMCRASRKAVAIGSIMMRGYGHV
jgi:hypothetical protein